MIHASASAQGPIGEYVKAAVVVLVTAAIGLGLRGVGASVPTIDMAMLFLLAVVIVASRYPKGPAVLAALIGIACFDFFFVPPYYTLSVSDARYILTFGVMLVVALVMGSLTGRIRNQAELARERLVLAERSRQAEIEMGAERLRTALLSSLSHDLRTPLASIEGSASTLLQQDGPTDDSTRRELASTILQESQRMSRLVGNLLDMIRVETGALQVQREWQLLSDVIGVALLRTEERMKDYPVSTTVSAALPLVPVDEILLEQVFVNLLENAARHTPPGTPIEIGAEAQPGEVLVSVADRGPGVPPGQEDAVFHKFHRGGTGSGVGLGLTICRGIITAHGGRIWVENRPGGGAMFRFTLPIVGTPPTIGEEEGDSHTQDLEVSGRWNVPPLSSS
jgi:K+-sensing histidine kinase KdpD